MRTGTVCSKEARSSTPSTSVTASPVFKAWKDHPDRRALKGYRVSRGPQAFKVTRVLKAYRENRDHKGCKVKQARQDRRVRRVLKGCRESRDLRGLTVWMELTGLMELQAW